LITPRENKVRKQEETAMKAAIYCRVSTEEQGREGTSLDSQREACLSKAHRAGYDVPGELIFRETYSGLALERPRLNELRELVRAGGVDVIIVYCLDRLSRDPTHGVILTQELEKHSVKLEAVTEDVDNSELGKLIAYIRGYAAKLEAEKIRERTMRGARTRAKQGKIPIGGTGKLYGYTYMKGKGAHEGIRYINEDEAKWVREIYRWFIEEGLTVNAITLRLRALGVPVPGKGQFWRNSSVHELLRNPAYTGKTYAFTYDYVERKNGAAAGAKRKRKRLVRKPFEQWVEIPGATPLIISQETFELAQARLKQNKRLAARNSKRQYLLSGYVFCRQCSRRYRGKNTKPKRGDNVTYVPYYECPGQERIVSPTPCKNRRWNANHLERVVWEQIESLLSKPEVILAGLNAKQNEANEAQSLQHELDQVSRQLKGLDREQEQLLQWALKGFPEETVIKENERINRLRAELKQRRGELEARIEQVKQASTDIQGIERFCELARQNLGDLTFENKRLALEALQIKVWVDGSSVNIEGAIPIPEGDIVSMTQRCLQQGKVKADIMSVRIGKETGYL
jgi:site-specific DNA recombinase